MNRDYTGVRLKNYTEEIVRICDIMQGGLRGGLASVLGDAYAEF